MSIEQTLAVPSRLNWRVSEFCDTFRMGKTKFYGLVAVGKLEVIKCGGTTLITDAERQRFQTAMEVGEV